MVIMDQAGFDLRAGDGRLLPLYAYSPEFNPVERFFRLLKAPTANFKCTVLG